MKKPVPIILLALLFVANLVILSPQTLGLYRGTFGQLGLLFEIRHELVSSYVEAPDQDKMVLAAVRGMIDSLEDPHTSYFTPEDLAVFDRETTGSFSGIGAEVTIDAVLRRLKIVTPLDESPSWKAGVRAGDIILSIDGEDTLDMTINNAVDRLIGEAGTDVVVAVRHDSGEEETITITRNVIKVPSVRGLRRDDDQEWEYLIDPIHGIGYIRLSQFSDKTADDLRTQIGSLVEQKARGLVIDLRFNGGGLLDSAVEVADMLLPPDQRIVSVKGRTVPEDVYDSTEQPIGEDLQIVILANEFSASASEIVTGALHDNGRAKFIGTRTFGKGSVQQLRALPSSKGALKLTNAYYYLPNGEKIHRTPKSESWGVNPHDGFVVAMNGEQITQMHELRRKGDILRKQSNGDNGDKITPDWVEQEMADPQLAAGLRALIGKIESGDWPKVGVNGDSDATRQIKRENLVRYRDRLRKSLDEVKEELAKIDRGEPIEEVASVESIGKDSDANAAAKIDTPQQEPEPVSP